MWLICDCIGRRCRCSTELVARLEAQDRAVLRRLGRFYHQAWCAQLLEEALRVHAAEQAVGSDFRFVCERHLKQAAGLESKPSFTAERDAAFKIGALLPKLSMGCLKPLGERQGCSAADGRREGFACCLSASFI